MLATVLLQLAVIALCAVFVRAEVALLSLNRSSLERLAEDGDKRASAILSFIGRGDRRLNNSRVVIDALLMLGTAFSSANIVPVIEAELALVGTVAHWLCVLAVVFIVGVLSIAFGELAPRRAVMRDPQATAFRLFGFVRVGYFLLLPTSWLAAALSGVMLTVLGIKRSEPAEVITEERIKMLLDTGNERGTIDSMEHQMIKNIFEFDDISIAEVCTHRRDVNFLYRDDDISVWQDRVIQTRHNYYPICGDNSDDVIGVLSVRKFFRAECPDTATALRVASDEPFFVPENMKADILFNQMKEKKTYFAVVIDEYGGTRGVITIHDLLELLVGAMGDSGEETVEEIKSIGGDTWEILGSASLGEVSEALGIQLEDEDHDTFGGYVVGLLGSIPQDGAEPSLETDRLSIRVSVVSEHRIEKTEVRKKKPDTERAPEAEEAQ